MSFWSRLGNAFRARRVSDDVDEELASHIEEAIERANDSPFGLGASVFTTSLEEAMEAVERLESGMVWVNNSKRVSPGSRYGLTSTTFIPCFLAASRYFIATGWSLAGLEPKKTIRSVPHQSV